MFGYPSPTPSISANGATNGIVWAMQESNYKNNTGQAVLYAYDATNLVNLLYSSSQNAVRDSAGLSVKFAVPTIANGKVYVPGRNAVTVFGLLCEEISIEFAGSARGVARGPHTRRI